MECEDGVGDEGYDMSCAWAGCYVSLMSGGNGLNGGLLIHGQCEYVDFGEVERYTHDHRLR